MSKTMRYLPPGQDFFDGGNVGGHDQMREFGFRDTLGAPKQAPVVARAKGGAVRPSKGAPPTSHGYAGGGALSEAARRMAKGGDMHSDIAQDKVLVKKGIRQHETQEHGGQHADLKLRRGGKAKAPKTMKVKIASTKEIGITKPKGGMRPPHATRRMRPPVMSAPPPPMQDDMGQGPMGGPSPEMGGPPGGPTMMRRGGRARGC